MRPPTIIVLAGTTGIVCIGVVGGDVGGGDAMMDAGHESGRVDGDRHLVRHLGGAGGGGSAGAGSGCGLGGRVGAAGVVAGRAVWLAAGVVGVGSGSGRRARRGTAYAVPLSPPGIGHRVAGGHPPRPVREEARYSSRLTDGTPNPPGVVIRGRRADRSICATPWRRRRTPWRVTRGQRRSRAGVAGERSTLAISFMVRSSPSQVHAPGARVRRRRGRGRSEPVR